MKVFPYSVQWLVEPTLEVPCQVLIVAPKRKLHHAVDRNHLKRLTRECYRRHKEPLWRMLQEHGIRIALSLVYIHDEPMDYESLYRKFDKLIAALQDDVLRVLES